MSPPSVILVIWPASDIRLSIPLDDIHRLTLKLLKWLRYLAWAILHLDGGIATSDGDEPVSRDLEGETARLSDGDMYYFLLRQVSVPLIR